MLTEDGWGRERAAMVEQDLRGRGVCDLRVLQAMTAVPRHCFVPDPLRPYAYDDRPLPIGEEQTISQPYIVAVMSEALLLQGDERVLELGTGSGYQSAILAELSKGVWTIERSELLSMRARQVLGRLGYKSIRFRVGDGTVGWRTESPFDRILATGSLPEIPVSLVNQLCRKSGVFVGPIGSRDDQEIVRAWRGARALKTERLGACRFVPLIGRAGWPEPDREGESCV